MIRSQSSLTFIIASLIVLVNDSTTSSLSWIITRCAVLTPALTCDNWIIFFVQSSIVAGTGKDCSKASLSLLTGDSAKALEVVGNGTIDICFGAFFATFGAITLADFENFELRRFPPFSWTESTCGTSGESEDWMILSSAFFKRDDSSFKWIGCHTRSFDRSSRCPVVINWRSFCA